ncbi:MAG: right-handed parallel beta-helix repeat-containing protein [bacterium]|nr:right-handed parallel beta-helix repeat-containing protein [bacterium]
MPGSRGLLSVFFILTITAIQAEEGRIPIFEPIVLDGSVSDIQGNYVVTRNITLAGPATTPVIKIVGSHVTGVALGESVHIDLNGFTLTNESGSDAVIEATGLTKLVIRNGSLVVKGGHGIKTESVYDLVAEDLQIAGSIAAIPGSGLLLDRPSFVDIRGIRIVNWTDQSAIRLTKLDSGGGGWTGTIASNTILGSSGVDVHGIELGCDAGCWSAGVTIRDNVVLNSQAGAGIKIGDGSQVEIVNNTIEGAATHGIHVDGTFYRGKIVGNRISAGGAGLAAVLLDEAFETQVAGNIILNTGNASPGLELAGASQHNSITRNTLSGNGGPGILIGASTGGNTFGGNTLLDNGGPCPNAPSPSACPEPEVCDEAGNAVSFGDNIAGTTGAAGPC